MQRRRQPLPIGAEILPGEGVRFRVWAPRRRRVDVLVEGGPGASGNQEATAFRLDAESDGYFSGVVTASGPGTLYRYRLDGEASFPDPASRFQPQGPLGPSEVIDPYPFSWTDQKWAGLEPSGQVLYEMHIGTFTKEGFWDNATGYLPELVDLGVTAIELMPVSDYTGRFGWGYDGVSQFAPCRLYGRPDHFRNFVDHAHALGLGVVLDIVYNHFGPRGNFLPEFSDRYFSGQLTEWGDAPNFDGPQCGPVREFFLANIRHWVEEYHVDGFRIDATQQFFDRSPESIITAIAREARAAGNGRSIYVIGESEPQDANLMRPIEQGGGGLDALWCDDFHHIAMVAATQRNTAYYTDYRGTPQEFVSTAKWGFLYQGQINTRQRTRRGAPAFDRSPDQFILYLQNHDQVANSLRGLRLHQITSPSFYRAITAIWLLTPGTPLIFQGQEFAASSPFCYFTDQEGDVGAQMKEGRVKFLSQFRNLALPVCRELLPDPLDFQTFIRSKLDHAERDRPGHREAIALHRDLLRLRREDTVLSVRRRGCVDGAVIGASAYLLRYFGEAGDDRLVLVNLGMDQKLNPATEPLLAPPVGRHWEVLWSSEDPRYGGEGMPAPETDEHWLFVGQSVVVLTARPGDPPALATRHEA